MLTQALAGAAFALAISSPAMASSYMYHANCAGSYSKQGEESADITHQHGKPITCNGLILSLMDNGHVLLQIEDKGEHMTPLGFGSSTGLNYDSNPNFITLPLNRLYLQHSTNPEKPEIIDVYKDFAFLTGS